MDTSKIYVDFDSLFDTRQSLLYKLIDDKQKLADFINSMNYCFRSSDNFSIVDKEVYRKGFSDRDNSVILGCMPVITYLKSSIKHKIDLIEKRNSYYGENLKPELVLNTYPYSFPTEIQDVIKSALLVKLDINSEVTLINQSLAATGPVFFATHKFTSAFIYDFKNWIDTHIASVEKNEMLQECIFYFPELKYEDEEIDLLKKSGFSTIFKYLEFILSPKMNVVFVPSVYYVNYITAGTAISIIEPELKSSHKRRMEQEKDTFDKQKIDEALKGVFDGSFSGKI